MRTITPVLLSDDVRAADVIKNWLTEGCMRRVDYCDFTMGSNQIGRASCRERV